MGEWKSLKMDSGTGWKDVYREAGTGWKALTWEGVAIDVGSPCINRAGNRVLLYTRLLKDNIANANGTITDVCIYMTNINHIEVFVGMFYLISGTTYKCRSAANLGYLSLGENNKVVSLAVVTGDMIGIGGTSSGNAVDATTTGGLGYKYASGNHCIVNNESSYGNTDNYILSVYGTG